MGNITLRNIVFLAVSIFAVCKISHLLHSLKRLKKTLQSCFNPLTLFWLYQPRISNGNMRTYKYQICNTHFFRLKYMYILSICLPMYTPICMEFYKRRVNGPENPTSSHLLFDCEPFTKRSME